MNTWDEAAAEEEAWETAWKESCAAICAAVDKHNAEWTAKWPDHCKQCGGWGGSTFYQSHPYGMGSAYEPMTDPCEALPVTQCHRCGKQGLDEDGNGPCTHCGWNYDDGLQEY